LLVKVHVEEEQIVGVLYFLTQGVYMVFLWLLPTVAGRSEIGNKKHQKGSRIYGKSSSFNLVGCPYLICPLFYVARYNCPLVVEAPSVP
jgi:hypothetical protein